MALKKEAALELFIRLFFKKGLITLRWVWEKKMRLTTDEIFPFNAQMIGVKVTTICKSRQIPH